MFRAGTERRPQRAPQGFKPRYAVVQPESPSPHRRLAVPGAGGARVRALGRRHRFFVEKMHEIIKPQLKDLTRLFGQLEREVIYYRDQRQCQAPGCGVDVLWADAEIHHVEQHSAGGLTTLANGALVHKSCHPKGQKDVAAFAQAWRAKPAGAKTPL